MSSRATARAPWITSPKPVNSQILKSKVAVFAELFRTTQALAAALREKETLLKEVHHRVKNNLQIISSFLDLQAGRSQDPGARAALAESQGRMRVMALVHQLLYERSRSRYTLAMSSSTQCGADPPDTH